MYAFLKTQVVKDDRKYNYLKDGKNYRVFLTLPNTTDNVPHEVRYGGQDPIFIGTFEKDTYETEFGYRLSFKDTWVFHPRYEGENIDVEFTDSMYGLVKHRKATGDITYTLKKWTTIAKKAFRVFVESFDDSFAESIRDRQEPVVNTITKDWRVESEKFCEHTTHYMIGCDRFEFNPTLDDGTYTLDLSMLELIQDGLMKALLDVQRRISQQARDDVQEASQ